MRASPAVEQQCGYVPSTPNQLARAHSAQRPGVAVTRRLITSTNKMLHPNRPALIPGSIPPTCSSGSLDTGVAMVIDNPVNLRGSLDALPQEGSCEWTPERSASSVDQ